MGFSVLPLRLASIAGILMLLAGGLFLANLLGQHLLHGEPFTDLGLLVALIVIFSGVQLFALGIMAEYIARIFFGVLGKTAYTIRERTS
jgi:undecaprenyl-phosphate 4-deoxy-4-formamido-L-arabinose transferase